MDPIFDLSQPFETVDTTPVFDPSQPFEPVEPSQPSQPSNVWDRPAMWQFNKMRAMFQGDPREGIPGAAEVDPTEAKKQALSVYYANMRHQAIPFIYENMDATIKAYHGDPLSIDQAYSEISNVLNAKPETYKPEVSQSTKNEFKNNLALGPAGLPQTIGTLFKDPAIQEQAAAITAAGFANIANTALGLYRITQKPYKSVSQEGALDGITESIKNNKAFLGEMAKLYDSDYDKDAIDTFKTAGPAAAAEKITKEFLTQIPELGLILFSGPAAIPIIGVTSASNKYNELDIDKPEMSEWKKTVNAASVGLVIAVTFKLMTYDHVLGMGIGPKIKTVVQEGLTGALKDIAGKFFLNTTQLDIVAVAEHAVNSLTDIENPKGMFETVLNSSISSAPMNASFAGMGHANYAKMSKARETVRNTLLEGEKQLKDKGADISDAEIEHLRDIQTTLNSRDMDAAIRYANIENLRQNINAKFAELRGENTESTDSNKEQQPSVSDLSPEDISRRAHMTDEEAAADAIRSNQRRNEMKHHPEDTIFAIERMKALMPNLKVNFFNGSEDMPETGRAAAESRGHQGVEAFVDMNSGEVFINSEMVPPHLVPEKILQEHVRHYGFEATFSEPRINEFLDLIARDHSKDVADFAKRYAPADPETLNRYDMDTKEGQRNAAREFLAHSAKLSVKPDNWAIIQRKFNSMLRFMGIDQPFTTREVNSLLLQAKKRVSEETTFEGKSGGIMFSYKNRKEKTTDLPDTMNEAYTLTSLQYLQKISGYNEAKYHGNTEAAINVVSHVIEKKAIEIHNFFDRLDPNKKVIFVPILNFEKLTAQEERLNVLPLEFAIQLSEMFPGSEFSIKILKSEGKSNTDAPMNERASNKQVFTGELENKNVQVVLVDDNFTSGDTVYAIYERLKETGITDFKGILTFSASKHGKGLKLTPETLDKLLRKTRLSKEQLTEALGREPEYLTEAEAVTIFSGTDNVISGRLRSFIGASSEGSDGKTPQESSAYAGTSEIPPKISKSKSRQPLTENDISYLDAVNNANEASARELLEKAALKAGLTPEQIKSERTVIRDQGRIVPPSKRFPKYKFSIAANPNGFYSAVEKAVDESKQPSNTKAGWLAWLRNTPGIKAEEIGWIGLEDLPDGKITKPELLDFIRANNVKVKEIVKQYDNSEPKFNQEVKYSNYQLPGGKNYRELLLTIPRKGNFYGEPFFHSSHFPEPNILAHVRFNERLDAEGKKILFIEEIQSDWHQKGKKTGYRVSPEREKELRAIISEMEKKGKEATPEDKDKWVAAMNELQPESINSRPPDAPFKTTWPLLAFKRMIRWAAENGFEKIAWTTGEQQAERYDLSKQVNEVTAARLDNDQIKIVLTLPHGIMHEAGTHTIKELPEVVGKDLAAKIKTDLIDNRKTSAEVYSGLDLKVGGEGMKGFYDQILPSEVNKYVKKFGGKVGESKLLIKSYENISADEWDLINPNDNEGISKLVESRAKQMSAHSLDITPAMHDAAMRGQPLFSLSKRELYEMEKGTLVGYLKEELGEIRWKQLKEQRVKDQSEGTEKNTKGAINYGIDQYIANAYEKGLINDEMIAQSDFLDKAIEQEKTIRSGNDVERKSEDAFYEAEYEKMLKEQGSWYSEQDRANMADYLRPMISKMGGIMPNPEAAYKTLLQGGFKINSVDDAQMMLIYAKQRIRQNNSAIGKILKNKWFEQQNPVAGRFLTIYGDKAKIKPSPEFAKDMDWDNAGDYLTNRKSKNTVSAKDAAAKLNTTEEELLKSLQGLTSAKIAEDYKASRSKGQSPELERLKNDTQAAADFNDAIEIARGNKDLTAGIIENRKAVSAEVYRLVMGEPMPKNPDWNEVRTRIAEDYPENVADLANRNMQDSQPSADMQKLENEMIQYRLGSQRNIEKLRSILEDYARNAIPDENVSKSILDDISKLDQYSSQPTTTHPEGRQQAALEDILKKISGTREDINRANLLQAIDTLLNRTNLRRVGKGRVASLYADAQKELDEIRAIRQMSSSTALKLIEYNQQKADEIIAKGGDASEYQKQAALAEMYGFLNEKTPQELSDTYRQLDDLARHGRSQLTQWLNERKAQVEIWRNDTVKLASGGKGLMTPQQFAKIDAKRKVFGRDSVLQMQDLEMLLSWITRDSKIPFKDTFMYKEMFTRVHDAFQNKMSGIRTRRKALEEEIDRIFGTSSTRSRAQVMAGLKTQIDNSGVFRYQRDPNNREAVKMKKLSVEEARGLLSEYDVTGKGLNDYQAEAVRQRLADLDERLKDAVKSRTGDDFTDDMLNAILKETDDKIVNIPEIINLGELKEEPLTQFQALYYRLCWNQTNVRYKMAFNGWTKESIKQLDKFITPETQSLGKWLVADLAKDFGNIQDVYKKLYWTTIKGNDNYFPTSYNIRTDIASANSAELGNLYSGQMSVTPGTLSARRFHLMEPKREDALSMYTRHVLQMEHFKSHAETARDLRSLFNSKDVQESIRQYYGQDVNQYLKMKIEDFVNGGKTDATHEYWVDKFQSVFARTRIWWNTVSMVKQMFGITQYLNDIPTTALISGVADFLKNPAKNIDMLKNTDYFKNRWGGSLDRDIGLMMSRHRYSAEEGANFFSQLDEIGSLPTRLGDAFSVIVGGHAVYKYHYDNLIKEGMSQADAHKEALREWEMSTERAQQSGATHKMNRWQLDGSISRVWTTFQSNPMLIANAFIEGAMDVGKGRGPKGEAYAKLARRATTAWLIGGFTMSVIGQAAKNGVNGDDYELARIAKDTLMGPFASFTILGYALDTAANASLGLMDNRSMAIDDIGSAIRSGKKIASGDFDDEELYKAIEKGFLALGFTPGVGPAAIHGAGIMRELRRYYNLFTGGDK